MTKKKQIKTTYLENIQNKPLGTWEPLDRGPPQNYQNLLLWNIHAGDCTYKGKGNDDWFF